MCLYFNLCFFFLSFSLSLLWMGSVYKDIMDPRPVCDQSLGTPWSSPCQNDLMMQYGRYKD